jgi:O-antigen/teichoic acid export membrane protein
MSQKGKRKVRSLAREEGSTAKFLLRGSALRVTTAVVSALIGFFMMPFLVGRLGEHDYGIWIVATSLVGTYYLVDFGLSASVMRFAAVSVGTGDTGQLSRVVSTALTIYIALAVLIVILSLGLSAWAPSWEVAAGDAGDFRQVILITGVSLALGFPFKAFAGILQARLRYDLMSMIGLTSTLVGTAITVWLVSRGHGIVALAYVGLCTSVVTDLLFLGFARREAPGLEVRRALFDVGLVKELASFSVWSFLIQVSNQLRFRIDALVIGSFRSASDVTRYSVGARLSEIPDGMLYQTTNIVQPLLTGYHALGQRSQLLEALRLYTRVNVTLGVFAAGMLIILGEAFINRWMGPEYSVSVIVLYALALTRCVGFMLNPLDNSLYAIGKIKGLAAINVLDALLNLGLSLWLVRSYGIVGVALGTLIPMVVTRLVLVVPYACLKLDWPLLDYLGALARPLVVGALALMAVAATYAQVRWAVTGYAHIIVVSLLSAAFYLPVVFFFGLASSDRTAIVTGLRGAFGRAPVNAG